MSEKLLSVAIIGACCYFAEAAYSTTAWPLSMVATVPLTAVAAVFMWTLFDG